MQARLLVAETRDALGLGNICWGWNGSILPGCRALSVTDGVVRRCWIGWSEGPLCLYALCLIHVEMFVLGLSPVCLVVI